MSLAARQIERLLWLIPAAARSGGIALHEAARHLDVSPDQVLADLEVLTQREFYAPSGSTEGLQIWRGDGDRWHMSGPGAATLHRPVRLTRIEALCVALGIRGRRTRDARDLLARLETELMARRAEEPDDEVHVGLPDFEPDPEGLRAQVARAARERRTCRFDYLKRAASRLETRRLEPYMICEAEGAWYAVGRDPDADGPRAFRIDRMLQVTLESATFVVPDDFEPTEVLREGSVFILDPSAPTPPARQVTVHYRGEAARIADERWGGTRLDDGRLAVEHHVRDLDWLIRHVLGMGTEAEVIAPADVRELVARRLLRLLDPDAP
jgi:predicted DNA-binding transcriptional regulator YafY